MPQTSISGTGVSGYSTPAHFCGRPGPGQPTAGTYDARDVADLVNDFGVRCNPENLLTATAPLAVINRFLVRGAGEIEQACICANRYTPTDLNALTGNSLESLMSLNDDLAFWFLWNHRPNRSKPLPVQAELAFHKLDDLRAGKRIFSFQEAANAGNPQPQWQSEQDVMTRNPTTWQANRLYGNRARDNIPGQASSGWGCR